MEPRWALLGVLFVPYASSPGSGGALVARLADGARAVISTDARAALVNATLKALRR